MRKLIPLLLLSALFSCNENSAPTSVLTKAWETDSTLRTPESVLFDAERQRMYVSNIVGEPWNDDSTGFISIIDKQGKITQLKWIEGLHAPKGMGMYKDQLFIADNKRLVIVSIPLDSIIKIIDVPGAEQLNDITIDDNGGVYISDTKNPAIYKYEKDSVSKWLALKNMTSPNGLLARKNKIMLADMGSGTLYSIDYATKTPKVHCVGVETADGIVNTANNQWIVSNWNGVLYMVRDEEPTEILNTTTQKINAADIWYIAEEKILLVPTFFHNTVAAYKISVEE